MSITIVNNKLEEMVYYNDDNLKENFPKKSDSNLMKYLMITN